MQQANVWLTNHGKRAMTSYINTRVREILASCDAVQHTLGSTDAIVFGMADMSDDFHADIRGALRMNAKVTDSVNAEIIGVLERHARRIAASVIRGARHQARLHGGPPPTNLALPELENASMRGTNTRACDLGSSQISQRSRQVVDTVNRFYMQ